MGLQWLFCEAEQVEHLPLSKLKEAELYLAPVIGFFVFFVEEGEADDQEDAGVGLHANGGLQAGLGIGGGKEDELVDLVLEVG